MSDDRGFTFVGRKHPQYGGAERGKTSKGTVRYKLKCTGSGPDSEVNSRTMTIYETSSNGETYDYMEWILDAYDDDAEITFSGFTYEGNYEGKPYTAYNVTRAERFGGVDQSSDGPPDDDWSGPPSVQEAPARSHPPAQAEPPPSSPPQVQHTYVAEDKLALAQWAISVTVDNLSYFPEMSQPSQSNPDLPLSEVKEERSEWIKASAKALVRMAREVARGL